MEVQILDIWKGEMEKPGIRVQGGDGWLCRPEISEFPLSSEWLLALDGPGSKPEMSKDHALSACGHYWLRVFGDRAQGRISGQDSNETLTLAEIKSRLGVAAAKNLTLEAEVKGGATYSKAFGKGLVFSLQPLFGGWEIVVQQNGQGENLTRLTPPLHFAHNPRFIEPGHFFGTEKVRAAANVPGKEREFIFSPEVGKSIAGPTASSNPTAQDIETIRRYGSGKLVVLETRGNSKQIDSLHFRLELTTGCEFLNGGQRTPKTNAVR